MRKVIILVTCIVVLLCIPLTPVVDNSEESFTTAVNEPIPSQLNNPIVITSNTEMINAGFDGDGSIEDPYRIYSLYIPTDDTYGIWISNVDSYFAIWDCWITGSPHLGIGISDCMNANISDSIVEGAAYGISVVDTTTAFVVNCAITPEAEGIGLRIEGVFLASISGCIITGGATGSSVLSSTVFFTDNSFIDCVDGIIGEPISNCIISFNSFENCSSYGIRFEDNSIGCSIIGNTFTGFYTGGILLRYADTMSIISNNFTHCGLSVIGSSISHYEHTVVGNLVNSKPLLYLYNIHNAQYSGDDYGQIYLISCEDITIRGGLITSTQRGVFLAYSNDCNVEDVMITACQAGVSLDNAELNIIRNCTIRSCSTGVLLLSNSNYNYFLGNEISFSFRWGVLLNPYTQLNILVNNTFHHNDEGLLDDGIENLWDDAVQFGNFYDDYVGYGNYTIPGSANSVDHYPHRFVATYPSGGGLQTPLIVTVVIGLGISVTGVLVVLFLLKQVWSSKEF